MFCQNVTKESDYQKVVSLTTQGLVMEAIDQMMNIKKQKQIVSSTASPDVDSKLNIANASDKTLVHSVGTSTNQFNTSTPIDNHKQAVSEITTLDNRLLCSDSIQSHCSLQLGVHLATIAFREDSQ